MESVRTAKHMYILSINIRLDLDDDSRILLNSRSILYFRFRRSRVSRKQLSQRHEQIHKNDRDYRITLIDIRQFFI